MPPNSEQGWNWRDPKIILIVAGVLLVGLPIFFSFLVRPLWKDFSESRDKAKREKAAAEVAVQREKEEAEAAKRREEQERTDASARQNARWRIRAGMDGLKAEPDRLRDYLGVEPKTDTERAMKKLAAYREKMTEADKVIVEQIAERVRSNREASVVAMERAWTKADRDKVWIQEAERMTEQWGPNLDLRSCKPYLGQMEAMTEVARRSAGEEAMRKWDAEHSGK